MWTSRTSRWILIGLVGLLWPCVGAAVVVAYTLPNGLRVALQEDHRTPLVAVHVSYGVGWRDGPPGHRGLAHLYEHLMFEGSRHAPGDTFWRELERAGATEVNGVTGADTTDYDEIVPAHEVGLAVWLESDRLAFLLGQITPERLEHEKSVLLTEAHDHQASGAQPLLASLIAGALYPPGYPYREAPELPDDLRATTLANVQWFGESWYRPDNAILSLVGDFDAGQVRAEIDQYFGSIVASPPGVVHAPLTPVVLDAEERFDVDAQQRAAGVRIDWPTPPALSTDDGVLEVIMRLLADRGGGRLEQALEGRSLARRVDVTLNSRALGSVFEIQADGEPGEKPEELLETIEEELDRLRHSEVSEKELARVLRELASEQRQSGRSIAARAARLADYWRAWGTPDGFQRDADRFALITAADVRRVVNAELFPDRRVVAIVHESRTAAPGGRLIGRETRPGAAGKR